MARLRSKQQPRPRAPHVLLLGTAVAIVTVLAYSSSFEGGFVRDAAGLIREDPRIRELSAENVKQIWSGPYWHAGGAAPLYRPLTTSSFLLNYAVLGHGERPGGYHVLNLLLHLGNAALVYVLLRRLNLALAPSLFAAALFATHPVATEAVANIAGRADLLAATTVLAALSLHVGGPTAANPWRWRLGLFVATLAGLLAKENAAALIVVAGLYDLLVRRRPFSASYAVFGLAGATAFAARSLALADVAPYSDPMVDNPLRALSFLPARLTALQVLGQQLGLLVWPLRLSADYSYDQIPLFPAGGLSQQLQIAASGLAVFVLAALSFLLRRREPRLSFLVGFLLIALLPTSNLILLIGSIRADRFLYLPSAAFAGAVALAWPLWAERARGRLVMGLASLLVIGAAARTYARNADWRNDETLFRAAREVSPRSFRVHKGLAQAILAAEPSDARLEEAITAAEEAARILESGTLPVSERSADTFLLLGLAHKTRADRAMQTGREPAAEAGYQRARVALERAVVIDRAANKEMRRRRRAAGEAEAEIPDVGLGRIYDVLGNVCLRMGDTDCALDHFAYLRRLSPERSVSYMLSAWVLTQKGRLEEAAVMTLQAWLLDARPDAVSVLREIYRQLDPSLAATNVDGSLRLEAPLIRTHLEQACRAHGERARTRCLSLGT